MSSIQQAVANDITKAYNRRSLDNPIVQNHRSQRDDGNVNAEIEFRRKEEAAQRKRERVAEGGRAGGFNDRQIIEKDRRESASDDGYDEFGRRIGDRQKNLDRNARAQAALQRLKGKMPQNGASSSNREKSRSPRR
mmetsp:Transcript_101346/g.160247  ORF Transcript_101346/g.160247 Transcript_101346/m.160247 type:complete len:136 (-) Transcript_101346:17-424(-)